MNGRRRDFVKSDACMVGQKMSDAYGEKKVFLEGIYVVVLVGGGSDEDERRLLIFIRKKVGEFKGNRI